MAITQLNLYTPGQNLSNLANNTDYNRLGVDKTNISVNFGTTPATVSIKQGSIIEANGNLYTVSGADFSFQMTNATDNYIAFAEGTPTFNSVTVKGTYRDDKLGTYQADDSTRTLRWYIDQTEETYDLDDSLQSYNIAGLKTEMNGYAYVFDTTGPITATLTSTIAQTLSQEFFLYKPVNLITTTFRGGGGFVDLGAGSELQIQYNSVWIRIINLQAPGLGTNYLFNALAPGKYRLYIVFTSVGAGTATVTTEISGVYGQTNLDAPSVYA
jgi:hypothetical protein